VTGAMILTMVLCFALTISVAVSIGLAALAGIQVSNVNMLVYHEIRIADLYAILKKSVISSAVIMFIIANAGLFAYLITRAGVPDAIGQWLEDVLQDPMLFLLGVNAALFRLY
jgi:TRAP-type C4-dicarboxylate transport system permease large subunit